jgi:hypothetical protein
MNWCYLTRDLLPKNPSIYMEGFLVVGSDGFEPPKASPIDLQSTPFGHSGNSPNLDANILLLFYFPIFMSRMSDSN